MQNWDAINAVNPDGSRKYRYILNKGSSRSSKTISLIDCVDQYGRSNANKRMTVWRDTKTDCKKTVLNDALKHFKSTGRYRVSCEFNITNSIFNYSSGSTFEIHGTDDEETVHGLTQDVAWLNEPYKISKDTFDQIDQRTKDFVLIDLNPKKGHWTDDLEKDPRTLVIHSTFMDNPFCSDEERRKILSYQPLRLCAIVELKLITEGEARTYDIDKNLKDFTAKQLRELHRCRENEYKNSSDEFKWLVYGLGVKAERPNRIFKWKEISDSAYAKIPGKLFYGVDWGKVDPWAVIEAKYYDGTLYLREINYLSENLIRAALSHTEIAQITKDEEAGLVAWYWNRFKISRNSYIVCDPNRTLKILALRALGYDYAVAASKPGGSIVDGISFIANIPVCFTASSANIKYEQENYSNKVDRYGVVLEEPEDLDNHCMDAVRYVADYMRREGIIKTI
jgi:PBSX family phage terminase large subunit